MKVKMLTLQAGPKGVREPGKEYDVPDKEAKELIAGGYAQPVGVEKAASRRGAEKATEPVDGEEKSND